MLAIVERQFQAGETTHRMGDVVDTGTFLNDLALESSGYYRPATLQDLAALGLKLELPEGALDGANIYAESERPDEAPASTATLYRAQVNPALRVEPEPEAGQTDLAGLNGNPDDPAEVVDADVDLSAGGVVVPPDGAETVPPAEVPAPDAVAPAPSGRRRNAS